MPNLLGLSGGQPQKPTRFAPIYTGRWSSGIWTNRSPLRDAATTRISEKFYGPAGDALIAGSNTEVSNRLTLIRRPGNPVYDANSWDAVDRFYDFRLFGPSTEQIDVMVDQASALYSLYAGTQSLVWTKSEGAGQTSMQSVGNSLYFGNGVDNKKWLQTLNVWAANTKWNQPRTPFYSTFFIDPNGNIQQLTGTVINIDETAVTGDVLTVTGGFAGVLSAGCVVTFPAMMAATWLENQTVTVLSVSGSTFTADFTHADYTQFETDVEAQEISGNSTPISATTAPAWSTTVPSSGNLFQGGVTKDGSAEWTNRGNPVENWGIANDSPAITEQVGISTVSWQANTYYSYPGVLLDVNGNLQQITTAGKSGTTVPTWATSVGDTTTTGTAVFRMIETAAQMMWAANTEYTAATKLALTSVAAASGGTTIYTGTITGGGTITIGTQFTVSGFTNTANNGTFVLTASTPTTLTLSNTAGVAETNQGIAATQGSYVIGNAYGVNCLYTLGPLIQPTVSGSVSGYMYGPYGPGSSPGQGWSGPVGEAILKYPTTTGSASFSTTTQNSFSITNGGGAKNETLLWNIVNGAGETTGHNVPFSANSNYQLVVLGSLNIPFAGQYTFTITHSDGMIWGIGDGATLVSGPPNSIAPGPGYPQTQTAVMGYTVFGGTNRSTNNAQYVDTFTVNFPTAGVYAIEIDWCYWYHAGLEMLLQCNSYNVANGAALSGTVAPIWPSWSTSFAPGYPTVTDADGQMTWLNLGPADDFTFKTSTDYTLPDSSIIDPNGYTEYPYRTGVTGATIPTFSTGANQLTLDNPNLIWINSGTASTPPSGTVSTYNGGWKYAVALVNTLDNTVSNCSTLSAATGNFAGVTGVVLAPGAGLPDVADIDPQSDFVAIFRTTDGQSTPFLIPGTYTTYTLPLSQYLADGYTDTTPDTGLNNLIEGAIAGENTPPAAGAIALTYHLNRIFFAVGNVVYWTEGPDAPVGNGVNGVGPLNYDTFPSLVTRLMPTTSGLMVFTVSDVYLIQGTGTAQNPIQSGIPIMQGVGLASYNALDINGSIIGFFTTDNQFIIMDPSNGTSYAGFPLGDQFRQDNGSPGQNWNPANVYVTWHVSGEDQAWYVSDGELGWYRMMPTPAPEQGQTWCPFATIVGGAGAVQSIEVTPGVHKLLIGPVGEGSILCRDLSSAQDNGTNYPAWAAVGSAVLAQPGQVAQVSFITTDSVRTGTALTLGLLLDEALPYYTGPIDKLTEWENDPPGLKESTSFYAQRFYLNEMEEEAVCRHMQIVVYWAEENALNELTTLTVYGAYMQES